MPIGPDVLVNTKHYRDEEVVKAINSGTRKLVQHIDWQLVNHDDYNTERFENQLKFTIQTVGFNGSELSALSQITKRACEIYMEAGWAEVFSYNSYGVNYLIFRTAEQVAIRNI